MDKFMIKFMYDCVIVAGVFILLGVIATLIEML